MARKEDCIFCSIVAGEADASLVYQDDWVTAFMDLMPQAEGHTLVIPKHPAVDLLSLPVEAVGPLFRTTQRVAQAVKAALGASGILVAQLNGAAAGQTVFHLHVHVIGGRALDWPPG